MNKPAQIENFDSKKEPLEAVIVDISSLLEDTARDAAMEKLHEDKIGSRGAGGFFKKLWKHSLFAEYYQQKEIFQARQKIIDSDNVFANEDEDKKQHEAAMSAIIDRFRSEYDEAIHQEAGETKKELGDKSEDLDSKEQIISLLKEYSSKDLTSADIASTFEAEKNRIFSQVNKDNQKTLGSGQMYADNVFELAKQVQQAVKEGRSLEDVTNNINITIGKAKAGVRTEAQFNAVEKILNKISENRLGRTLVYNASLGSGVAIAYCLASRFSQSFTRSQVAQWSTFGATTLMSGGISALKESKRLESERSQYFRDMAKSKKFDEKTQDQEDLEKYRYETMGVNDLALALGENVYEKTDVEKVRDLDADDLRKALESLAEIEARITLSDTQKIDLISYSNAQLVEQERWQLDILRAQVKIALQKQFADKDKKDVLQEVCGNKSLNDFLEDIKEAKIKGLNVGVDNLENGIEAKNRLFKKMKRKKVALAGLKGALVGLGIGGVVREVTTIFNEQTGFFEQFIKENMTNDSGQVTAFEHMRHLFSPSAAHAETLSQAQIDAHAQELLLNDSSALADSTQDTAIQSGIEKTLIKLQNLNPQEYTDLHHEELSNIHRDLWYDNDTVSSDFNELKLHGAGINQAMINQNGDFVFSMGQMSADGSFAGDQNIDVPEQVLDGKLKMIFSLSKDTQNNVFEVPIDANGLAVIDKDSEIAKVLFDNQGNFLGQYGEVVEIGKLSEDNIQHVKVVATMVGKGVDNVPSQIIIDSEVVPTPSVLDSIPDTADTMPTADSDSTIATVSADTMPTADSDSTIATVSADTMSTVGPDSTIATAPVDTAEPNKIADTQVKSQIVPPPAVGFWRSLSNKKQSMEKPPQVEQVRVELPKNPENKKQVIQALLLVDPENKNIYASWSEIERQLFSKIVRDFVSLDNVDDTLEKILNNEISVKLDLNNQSIKDIRDTLARLVPSQGSKNIPSQTPTPEPVPSQTLTPEPVPSQTLTPEQAKMDLQTRVVDFFENNSDYQQALANPHDYPHGVYMRGFILDLANDDAMIEYFQKITMSKPSDKDAWLKVIHDFREKLLNDELLINIDWNERYIGGEEDIEKLFADNNIEIPKTERVSQASATSPKNTPPQAPSTPPTQTSQTPTPEPVPVPSASPEPIPPPEQVTAEHEASANKLIEAALQDKDNQEDWQKASPEKQEIVKDILAKLFSDPGAQELISSANIRLTDEVNFFAYKVPSALNFNLENIDKCSFERISNLIANSCADILNEKLTFIKYKAKQGRLTFLNFKFRGFQKKGLTIDQIIDKTKQIALAIQSLKEDYNENQDQAKDSMNFLVLYDLILSFDTENKYDPEHLSATLDINNTAEQAKNFLLHIGQEYKQEITRVEKLVKDNQGQEKEYTEIARPSQVEIAGDLDGDLNILFAKLKDSDLVELNGQELTWAGGKARLIFVGDICGDRDMDGFAILGKLQNLREQAEQAGGTVDWIAGNHEQMLLNYFLDGDAISADPKFKSDPYTGILEPGLFSTDDEFKKDLLDFISISKKDTVKGKKFAKDKNIIARYEQGRQEILTNMRKDPEGKKTLENLTQYKLLVKKDDTLVLHTPLTGKLAMILSQAKDQADLETKITEINQVFQEGLQRFLIDGEEPSREDNPEFFFYYDTFLETDNRYNFHEPVFKDRLRQLGINAVIHGHNPGNSNPLFKPDFPIISADNDPKETPVVKRLVNGKIENVIIMEINKTIY